MPAAPLQFGLKTLMALTAAVALLFAAGWWFGAAGYGCFFALAGLLAIVAVPRFRNIDYGLLYGAFVLLMAVLLSMHFCMQAARSGAQRSVCVGQLKQIGAALQNYNDVYGCLPPVCITDPKGKPMHSWRVLILPFIGQQQLYDQYDFSEPWDAPHNSRLAKEMPAIFRSPEDATNLGTKTNYVAVVGPETIWQPDRGTTFAEIKDGPINTIAVIKAGGAGVCWMEPRDLPFADLGKVVAANQSSGALSMPSGGLIAAFAGGHTQSIDEGIPLEKLKALFTKAAGDEIGEKY